MFFLEKKRKKKERRKKVKEKEGKKISFKITRISFIDLHLDRIYNNTIVFRVEVIPRQYTSNRKDERNPDDETMSTKTTMTTMTMTSTSTMTVLRHGKLHRIIRRYTKGRRKKGQDAFVTIATALIALWTYKRKTPNVCSIAFRVTFPRRLVSGMIAKGKVTHDRSGNERLLCKHRLYSSKVYDQGTRECVHNLRDSF